MPHRTRRILLFIGISIVLLLAALLWTRRNILSLEESSLNTISPAPKPLSAPNVNRSIADPFIVETKVIITESPLVQLSVPYVNESPDGSWKGSWKNACEEATIAMIDAYYRGETTVSKENAMVFMQLLFDAQQKERGTDANSTVAQTLDLLLDWTIAEGRIVESPTIDMIKAEIDAGRPVIAFHKGFDLGNKNIPFLATGSSYHATVVVGYDDAAQEFLVHDTGDNIDGPNHRYDYTVYMNSLHDYQESTKLADGPARTIFTSAPIPE